VKTSSVSRYLKGKGKRTAAMIGGGAGGGALIGGLAGENPLSDLPEIGRSPTKVRGHAPQTFLFKTEHRRQRAFRSF
jgi:hypothetical protein